MKCLNCGKPIPDDRDDGFCSDKCYIEYYKKERKENIEKYLGWAGIGAGLTKIMKKCKLRKEKQDLLEDFITGDKWMFVYGESGTGKTIFCCYVIKELIERLGNPFFISVPTMVFKAQKKVRTEEGYYDFIDEIVNTKILILDDLGVEKITDFTYNLIYYIINNRIEKGLKTLVVSNLDLPGLQKKIGDDRIPDRIKRACVDIKHNIVKFKEV